MTPGWKLFGAALALFAGTVGPGALFAQTPLERPHVMKMIGATVFPAGYSEIWFFEAPEIRFITNLDLSVFDPGGLYFETEEAIYDFLILPGIYSPEDVRQGQQDGSIDGRGLPKETPWQLPPRAGPAKFIPATAAAGSWQSSASGRLCDLVHRYYQANRSRLEAEARQRKIDQAIAAAAHAAWLAAIPPHFGPPVAFKRIEFVKPSPNPSKP